jgi:hypothetical protein
MVTLARHGIADMSPPKGAAAWPEQRKGGGWIADVLGDRAAAHLQREEPEPSHLRTKVRMLVADLDDTWTRLVMEQRKNAAGLQYQREVSGPQALLHMPLDPELKTLGEDYRKFRARRSLRDVEPNVSIWIKRPDGRDLDAEEEA